MQPQYRTHEKVLNNWHVDYDDYAECYCLCHYVGGEDGVTYMGDYDTKEEAQAARLEANKAGHIHTHIIDL